MHQEIIAGVHPFFFCSAWEFILYDSSWQNGLSVDEVLEYTRIWAYKKDQLCK